MGEYLSFVTIDVWTMIFTWANLLILFLLMKKFLFGPVRRIIEKREEEINSSSMKLTVVASFDIIPAAFKIDKSSSVEYFLPFSK